jgi:hypothetical protein
MPLPKGVRLKGKYARGVERPQVWLIGSDAGKFKHDMYHPWQMAKAQAKYRHEEWDLDFEDYYLLWRDHWDNRGRLAENMCMTRRDPEIAWCRDNICIILRREHARLCGQRKRGLL